MINDLGTPSFELQINFDALQTDTENSATGHAERDKMSTRLTWECVGKMIIPKKSSGRVLL